MCQKLGIRIIAPSQTQAKGRLERAHGTHQDRLVKKLRLAGIARYEEANRHLEEQYLASTTGAMRGPRPLRSIITGDDRRQGKWTKSSGWGGTGGE
jgi:hypothetical protein